jgi:EAL and modified HD-GYP domain-containing signal transduction protein
MLMTAPQETAAPVVLSRQPIFDCFERVVGYELLTPISGDPAEATAGVLSRALLDMGHQRLAGHVPMHVDVSRDFLLGVRPLPFSPEEVVLEVAGDQAADAALVQALLAASAAGFRITLDGFGTGALLDLAHAVKLDVARAHQDELAALVDVAHDRGLSVIAGGVHTRRAASLCRDLGFDAFQGRFFAEPEIVTGASAPTQCLRALWVLADDPTFEELERVIGEDAGLSLKLARLANSAFFGGRRRVATVREALLTLGTVTVARWATLLALAGAEDRPSHLLETGLLRARLCERLARRVPDCEPERAFTIGLFSVAGALLGRRTEDVLAELPFDARTESAIADHVGPEGELLAGVLAYEAGDFESCAALLADLALVCAEALDWTGSAVTALAA